MTSKEKCSLCSQIVEIPGFELDSKEGQKVFCCEGCLSIFQLFNEKILLPPSNNERKK